MKILLEKLFDTSLKFLCIFMILMCFIPYIVGAYYNACIPRTAYTYSITAEQQWLDRVIEHLKTIKSPELQPIIDYTITRYNKIGGFDVAILPLPASDDMEYMGWNCLGCPGVTLDPKVMRLPIHQGAKILLHEAAHDFYPYVHPLIDEKMRKINEL
jgi:hypothetical protein